MQQIAIFDLDRTITRSGTFTPCLLGWAVRHAPHRLLLAPIAGLLMLGHVAGLMSRDRLKVLMLRMLLGPVPKRRLANWSQQFAKGVLKTGCRPKTIAEIRRHQAAGTVVAIATASFDWCAAAIASELGVPHVIATRSRWDADDRLVFAIDGHNCYAGHKLQMIKTAFEKMFGLPRTGAHVTFYSDHHSDLPCFEWADVPIIVNPSLKLQSIAASRGFGHLA